MKKLGFSMFAILVCSVTFSASAAELKINIQPTGDGVLIDNNKDGIVDQVVAAKEDEPSPHVLELMVGKMPTGIFKPTFEFKLPATPVKLKQATLTLFLNGKFGCSPEMPGTSGPETLLWSYLPPEADGVVELTDDGGGQQLGIIMPGKPEADPRRAITFDVTSAVRTAMEKKAAFIGFRLEATAASPANCAWRFRSSEFAEKFAKAQCPALNLVTE